MNSRLWAFIYFDSNTADPGQCEVLQLYDGWFHLISSFSRQFGLRVGGFFAEIVEKAEKA